MVTGSLINMLPCLMAAACLPTQRPIAVESSELRYTPGISWENRKTGARLNIGGNPEVELECGVRPESAARVGLVADPQHPTTSSGRGTVIHLRSPDGRLTVTVSLQADPKWPLLHKTIEVANVGTSPVRLLNLVLGRLPVGKARVEGGDRGFPVYLNQEFFLSLTHPAGFAHVEGRDVVLRQYPGVKIAPGKTFRSMEAIYGVAKRGEARKAFVDYVRSRMCRVLNGHDRALSILESFGGQPEGDFKTDFSIGVSESYLLRHLDQVTASERLNGVQFDFYGLEFWHDRAGTLKEFNLQNFPNGFDRVRDKMLGLGMKPGLWIDSGNLPQWSIDRNPAMRPSYSIRDGEGAFCRASEPIDQIYKDAFLYQMKVNKAGLLKFDNLNAECVNPAHDHLPGPLYSTEAIYNGVIDFLTTLRRANPDVFIMLYWGYRSPWWLEYGDTYFECGDHIEAASPAQYPTPYARDAVTQRLDQAQLNITDTPWLGKDSLGVWLSDWSWNSGIGKARWQEAEIMDMMRGSLLFEVWTDADWLTPPERDQVAMFQKLLKANSDCFDNTRFILGNPNHEEPYGYSGSNGKRAYVAIDNACLQDRIVDVDLGPSTGLPAGKQWDVYRWYPRRAKLAHGGNRLQVTTRPYEVDLFEIVPKGAKPSLPTVFRTERSGEAFSEPTRELPVSVTVDGARKASWRPLSTLSAVSAKGASLTIQADGSILASGSNKSGDTYLIKLKPGAEPIRGLLLEALTDPSLPANGPGRAVNGNFALTGIKVQVAGAGGPEDLSIVAADADFSQTSFGGWPVAAAIDDDPKSGWSIHPETGQDHAGVFRFGRPVSLSAGEFIQVTLTNGENGHSLGRFRLSSTSDESAILPEKYQPERRTLTASIPPTRTGGIVLLTGGSPSDAPRLMIGGKPGSLVSVWSAIATWACPWTAWRAEVGPSDQTRRIEFTITRRRAAGGTSFKLYWLPQ